MPQLHNTSHDRDLWAGVVIQAWIDLYSHRHRESARKFFNSDYFLDICFVLDICPDIAINAINAGEMQLGVFDDDGNKIDRIKRGAEYMSEWRRIRKLIGISKKKPRWIRPGRDEVIG